MTREEEIEYAAAHGIPVPVTLKSPYSHRREPLGPQHRVRRAGGPVGRAARRGLRLDADPAKAPDEPLYIEIDFEQGIPVGARRRDHGRREL